MNKKHIGLQAVVVLSALLSLVVPYIGDWAQSKIDDDEFENRVNEVLDKREEAKKNQKRAH